MTSVFARLTNVQTLAGGGGGKEELSSLFNKKRSSDHIFGKIGFTSNVLLSEDDYVPHLMKMCFTLL